MDFLPVTSDMQTLELAYSLHKNLLEQYLSFEACSDISLGLIETNGLKAVLTAQPSLLDHEKTVITLRACNAKALKNDNVVVTLEPLQQLNLQFHNHHAVIDDVPLILSETTPYYSLVQHLGMTRLEYILAEMDVFYLSINAAMIPKEFVEVLALRAYCYTQGTYNKYLLMTNTINVLP
jgi:hypothetical protein